DLMAFPGGSSRVGLRTRILGPGDRPLRAIRDDDVRVAVAADLQIRGELLARPGDDGLRPVRIGVPGEFLPGSDDVDEPVAIEIPDGLAIAPRPGVDHDVSERDLRRPKG